jgi:hypothetical protein
MRRIRNTSGFNYLKHIRYYLAGASEGPGAHAGVVRARPKRPLGLDFVEIYEAGFSEGTRGSSRAHLCM